MRFIRGRWGVWVWSLTGWWLFAGPIKVGLRDHRRSRPLFSERNKVGRGRHYIHVGPYCLVLARHQKEAR